MSSERPFLPLLAVACAVLVTVYSARHPDEMPGNKADYKAVARNLMKKCREKGYQAPQENLLRTVLGGSDSLMEDRSTGQSTELLPEFMNTLNAVFNTQGSSSLIPFHDKMTTMKWNGSHLTSIVKQMRNYSDESVCYMHAFVAAPSWEALTMQSDDVDLVDYDTLLWAAKPALQDFSSRRLELPIRAARPKARKMMEMLQEMYGMWSDERRAEIVLWMKEQVAQNDFNCTMRPSSDSRLQMTPCNLSMSWLNSEALTMLGPYLSYVTSDDVDSSPKEYLCEFFRSAQFKSALRVATKLKPSLARRFLRRFRECFSEEEFVEHVDKLGTLACYYHTTQNLSPDQSKKLLFQLNDCDNPTIKKLKERLVKSVMSNQDVSTQSLRDLGSSVNLLSPKQISMIAWKDLKEIQENVTVQWTQGQMHALVKKKLSDLKGKLLSGEDLRTLKSLARGLPSRVLKHVKAQGILNDPEAMNNISKQMRKGQLKALLQGLGQDLGPRELVQNLRGNLLSRIPLDTLTKANINSLDQVERKIWRRAQAAYLAKKLQGLKQLSFGRLHSILQGITCDMIDKVEDSDVQDMAQAITETPQWLSKVQTGCAARKLFATLESQRADYFKTITEDEMDEIPTMLLVHLPPSKVKDLPDSVCPSFLRRMEVANMSCLPIYSPSRLALTQKALLCLGNDSSRLTTEDVSRLGHLLCELKPFQLHLLAPDVLNSSLRAMANCKHIPRPHRAAINQLVVTTFGDPSDWSPETMEELGPLLLLDDDATAALPNKPWMKDVLYFLKSKLFQESKALRRKIFTLTTSSSNAAREKRAADSGSSGAGTDSNSAPTVDKIKELEMNNVYWTAEQLDQMSSETFAATVDTLGKIPDFSSDQLAVLSSKAITVFGPVENMTESVVAQMGCINRGFPDSTLRKLPFSLDTLEDIGHCGWNQSQMGLVWKAAAEHNNLTAQQLGAVEMVALNQFICGLNSSEFKQLNLDAFKEAVDSMEDVQCSHEVMRQIKSLAVSAFKDPSTWTETQVSDLGNVIAGLDATELASLKPSVFSFISESSIPFIPPSNLAVLSDAQLEAFGPDNAAKVTSEQRAALRDTQRAALERAMSGSHNQLRSSDLSGSGAPSLSIEGTSAFMKPLLFLLTGFLLL